MSSREITVLTDVAMITCVVQRDLADVVIDAARKAGAQGATVHYAKGMGVRERLGILGIAVNVEKEVINIIVSTDQVELLFERMYLAGQFDTPGMGIMYVTRLEKAATHIPEAVRRRLLGHKVHAGAEP